jgi:hypothetical protein
VGKDEGRRLWMLAAEKVGQLVRLHGLQEVKGRHFHRRLHPHHQLFGAIGAHGLLQDLTSVLDPALRDVALGPSHVSVLQKHVLDQVTGRIAHPGNLDRDLLHLSVVQVLEDLAGRLDSQRNEQNGGLLCPTQLLGAVGQRTGRYGRRLGGSGLLLGWCEGIVRHNQSVFVWSKASGERLSKRC